MTAFLTWGLPFIKLARRERLPRLLTANDCVSPPTYCALSHSGKQSQMICAKSYQPQRSERWLALVIIKPYLNFLNFHESNIHSLQEISSWMKPKSFFLITKIGVSGVGQINRKCMWGMTWKHDQMFVISITQTWSWTWNLWKKYVLIFLPEMVMSLL